MIPINLAEHRPQRQKQQIFMSNFVIPPFKIKGLPVLIGAYFHDFKVDRYHKIDENSWNFFPPSLFSS